MRATAPSVAGESTQIAPGSTTSTEPPPRAIVAKPGGELLIACDGPPFSTSVLDRPADAELEAHPAAELLRSMIVDPRFEAGRVTEGWWKTADAVTEVWYLGRIPDDTYIYYRIEFGAAGWTSNRFGDCGLWPAVEMVGLSPATWQLDPAAADLEPETITVGLLVTELACRGGASVEDRLLQPAVIYGERAVTIITAAAVLTELGDCPADPAAPLQVDLREPLGDRVLRGWEPPPEGTGG